jgi:hypothetical protein
MARRKKAAIAVAVQGFLADLEPLRCSLKHAPAAHSFIALMEAIVQINMNAELLRLISQLLDQFSIRQP